MILEGFYYTDTQKKKLLKSMTVLIDTREKENKHITDYFDAKGILYKSKALEQGDYSFLLPKNEELSIPRDIYFSKKIMIERKGSLEEISGNWSTDRARFEKEMALAPERKVLIIENASYANLVDGKYRTDYSVASFLGTLHSFWHRYNIPAFFVPDRRYSGLFIYKFFEAYLREQIKT